MVIDIDTKLLKKLGLNINEYLTLMKIYLLQSKNQTLDFVSTDELILSLVDKKFISRDDSGIRLTQSGFDLFIKKVNKLDELVDKLKDIYPKGKKNGQYYWFGNKPEVKTKLNKFFKTYKNVSYDQVEIAVKNYVDSFTDYNRDSGMMLLKYFIIKDDMSTLYTYVENIDDKNNEEVKSFEKNI